MNSKPSASPRWWLWAAVLLTAYKLWLTRGLPVYAIGSAAHDERLFLQLAESIVRGEWLGAYSQMTLAKGCFYSLFIAVVFWIGLPLTLAQQLIYAGACAAFTRATAPSIRSGAARFVIYAFLLWNPMSYEAHDLGRVMRQHVYTPLGMLIFAGLVALYDRRSGNFRRQAPWAVLLGVSLGCFWLTREESIWLAPSVALLAAAWIVGAIRTTAEARRNLWRAGLTVTGCALLPVLLVSGQNYRHYGWFGTVEFHAPEFKDAYGAMVRVKIGPDLPFVPVTRQAREAMYAVSPAFATLRPWLDGDIGTKWAEKEIYPATERQIRGGWLVWALRDSVVAAGHGHNAREALAFYRQMADEINRACDNGRLPARSRRSGFVPVWREGQTAELTRTFFSFFDFVVSFRSFSALPPLSTGDNDELQLFRDLTRDRLSSSERATNIPLPEQERLNVRKFGTLQQIGSSLQPVLLVMFFVTSVLALVRAAQVIRSRQLTYPFVLALAAFGGFVAYLLVNALVQVSSFNVVAVSTFAPIYPLLMIFMVTAIWDAAVAWLGKSSTPQTG